MGAHTDAVGRNVERMHRPRVLIDYYSAFARRADACCVSHRRAATDPTTTPSAWPPSAPYTHVSGHCCTQQAKPPVTQKSERFSTLTNAHEQLSAPATVGPSPAESAARRRTRRAPHRSPSPRGTLLLRCALCLYGVVSQRHKCLPPLYLSLMAILTHRRFTSTPTQTCSRWPRQIAAGAVVRLESSSASRNVCSTSLRSHARNS